MPKPVLDTRKYPPTSLFLKIHGKNFSCICLDMGRANNNNKLFILLSNFILLSMRTSHVGPNNVSTSYEIWLSKGNNQPDHLDT